MTQTPLDYARFALAMAAPTAELIRTLHKAFKGNPEPAKEQLKKFIHIVNHGKQLESVQQMNDQRIEAARLRNAKKGDA